MTKNELIETVQRELDGSMALPTQVPSEEIGRHIDQSAKWFYENYREAVQSQYYIVPNDSFSSADFTAQRVIQMPPCVVSVFEVREISGAGLLGTIDRDFSSDKLIASEIYLQPLNGDNLVNMAARLQYYDLAKAFFLDWIRYDFNRRTGALKILGRNPMRDVLINTYVKIPDEKLFEDYYFTRYVTAKSKLSLARMLEMFNFTLMGGITINVANIRSEAETEITEIMTAIKEEDSADWFITYH
jgi:hypothetical protein